MQAQRWRQHHSRKRSGNSSGGSLPLPRGGSQVLKASSGQSQVVAHGGNYFLLVKRGNDFVVRPAGDWYTFRPVNARCALTHGRKTMGACDCQNCIAACAYFVMSHCPYWHPLTSRPQPENRAQLKLLRSRQGDC